MTLAEGIKKAVESRNAALAGRLADYCRFKLGMRYNDVFEMANRITGISAPAWETLMYESDQELPPGAR